MEPRLLNSAGYSRSIKRASTPPRAPVRGRRHLLTVCNSLNHHVNGQYLSSQIDLRAAQEDISVFEKPTKSCRNQKDISRSAGNSFKRDSRHTPHGRRHWKFRR